MAKRPDPATMGTRVRPQSNGCGLRRIRRAPLLCAVALTACTSGSTLPKVVTTTRTIYRPSPTLSVNWDPCTEVVLTGLRDEIAIDMKWLTDLRVLRLAARNGAIDPKRM